MPFEYFRNAEGLYACKDCDYKYTATLQSTMHMHIKIKHQQDSLLSCDLCGKRFLSKREIENHKVSKHNKEPKVVYKCPVPNCNFDSISKGNRRIHFAREHLREYVEKYMKSNKKQGTLECSCCQKALKSNTSFMYHIADCLFRTKQVENPYLAEICS